MPVDGQKELVSLKVQQIKRDSPLYAGVDTKVELGFAALHMFWKPKTMQNLLAFLAN